MPSMFMNYQSVYTVKPNALATGTWSLDGQLIPNPISFAAYSVEDSTGHSNHECINSQIPGATHQARWKEFLSDFTRWRLAYASVTIYQDGPDLSNQGTVVVCQKPVAPSGYNIPIRQDDLAMGQVGSLHMFHLEPSDLPNYASSQAMPNAYFGRSKDGAYIPLKLTNTHQKWHSLQDAVAQACLADLSSPLGNTPYALVLPATSDVPLEGIYPFVSMNDAHIYTTPGENPKSYTIYDLTSAFCNDNWADFSFKNMSVNTSLSMFFRFGFEVQLQPGSSMSPHLKLSPPYDPAAISAYFAIARELKDAYPAEYNDKGKIWEVISGIAKAVAPGLVAVPIVGPMLATGVGAAAKIGDMIHGYVKRSGRPTLGNVASAADLDRTRNAINNTTRVKPRTTRKQAKKGKFLAKQSKMLGLD